MAGPGETFPEIEEVERHVPYRLLVNQERKVINDVFPLPVRISENASPFSEVMIVERTPILAHTSTDPLSILRDFYEEINGGTVTNTGDEFLVDAPAVGDRATFETAQRGRYVPGFASEAGIGIRFDHRDAGAMVKWGLFDDNNGFEFIYDDNGFGVEIRRNGVSNVRTNRGDWSVDNLDGNGPSGIDVAESGGLDAWLAEGRIWQVRYSWYGYGAIEWGIIAQRDNPPAGRNDVGPQRLFVLHRDRILNTTSVAEPNLPVGIECEDGASLYVGGRQFSVIGPKDVEQRDAGEWRLQQSVTADGTFKPLIAVRRRTDADWPREVKVTTNEVAAITNQSLVLQTFVGATVDDGAWVPVSNNPESAVEVNKTATSMTIGNAIGLDPTLAISGGGNTNAATTSPGRRTALPRLETMVLAARVIGGQNATVSSVMDWLEIR